MNKRVLLLIIWMIVIFTMSSFNAEESSNQSGLIVNIISNIFNIENVQILSFIIRKLAHFTEYFILGVLMLNTFNKFDKKSILIAVFLCILYAFSDEIHQIFIDGRSCQLRDVLIDSLGSIFGIFTLKILKNLK